MTSTDSILGIPGGRNLLHSPSLNFEPHSSHQSLVDGLVGGFVEQATDWRSLAAMMVGGVTYRLGRVGALAAGTGRLASLGIGLGAEVTAFEMTNRSLSSLTGETQSNPNLWRWEGQGGIRQGLLSSLVTFGTLKGAGRLVQGENVVVQHLLQDTGMVLGHQVSASFGITDRPQGTLAEQFLHAEATNLQLGAGMALAHSMAPGIQGLERGLDLSLRLMEAPETIPQNLLHPSLQLETPPGSLNPWGLVMMTSNPGDGNGDRGKGGRIPDTLPQIPRVRETRSSSQIPLSIFRQGQPYLIEGISDGSRQDRVKGNRQDPLRVVVETFDQHLAQDRTSLVLIYEGEGMEERIQGQLRIDMHRLFRDRGVENGVPMALVIPEKNLVILYTRRGDFVDEKRRSLNSPVVPSTPLPPGRGGVTRPAETRPPSPVEEVSAKDPARVIVAMRHALKGERPRVRYTGSIWKTRDDISFLVRNLETTDPLPLHKTFTLVLEKAGKQFEFYWDRDRIQIREKSPGSPAGDSGPPKRRSTEPGLPASRTIPPEDIRAFGARRPPTPSGESASDQRLDTFTSRDKDGVEAALEKALRSTNELSVIRLSEGRIGQTEILSYARILSEHPMADGQKIMISWREKGGGRLTLHRQGDRITAELLGKYQVLEQSLVLLPENPLSGNLVPYVTQRVQTFPFVGQKEFDTESYAEVVALLKRVLRTEETPNPTHVGLEGGSLRGDLLGLGAQHLLRSPVQNASNFFPEEWNDLPEIHRLLEKAYVHLDFDTLKAFAARMGSRLPLYQTAIRRWNETHGNEQAELTPLEVMTTDLPGSFIIPVREHLRYSLLGHIFSDLSRGRHARENIALFRDPERLGQIFSKMFVSYIRALLSNVHHLITLAPQEKLANLFNTDRKDLGPEVLALREEIRIRLQDLSEYGRILSEKSSFQRTFFRVAFSSTSKLREPYDILGKLLSELPPVLYNRATLPSLSEIDRYSRQPSGT